MDRSTASQSSPQGPINIHWLWVLLMGVIITIGGIWALVYSCIISVLTVFWFGALLVATGILQIFSIFFVKRKSGLATRLLLSLLSIIAGCWIIYQPLAATVTLLWVIAFYLFISGFMHILFAFNEGEPSWYWLLLAGIIEVILAFMMWANWPVTGLWIMGLFISIHVLMTGWYFIGLAFALRKH